MTPKEKAIDLFFKYFKLVKYPTLNWRSISKECALIAVDELIEYSSYGLPDMEGVFYDKYWVEVKEEIEKL